MMQELVSITDAIEALEIDLAQKQELLRLLFVVEKQFKTFDFRLERISKDKLTLTTLLTRTSEDLDEERKKVEAANRAKSDFLAIMSHEIRTPLNAIIGMTSLLLDTNLTPSQQEFASTIRTSGDALLSIINDILDFSKIEAGRIDLEQRSFDLHQCVEDAVNLFLETSLEKGLEIVYMIDTQVPRAIIGDENRLRQILLNLLSNAIKFTETGGVTLSVTSESTSEMSVHQLLFSVQDTGLGIPQEGIRKLFHSFTQLDSSTTRKYGGTGLGLAISKRLAELMGGTMWVESDGIKGMGSTFHFTIQASETENQPLAIQPTHFDIRNRRVLIVDEDTANLRTLAIQTHAWGLDQQSTSDPTEALEWIRKGNSYDIALIGYQMPKMDGILLARAIRKLRDRNELPIILISPKNSEVLEQELFSAQLHKPVRASHLYDTLILILSERSESPEDTVKTPKSIFDSDMGKRLPLRILLAEDHITNQKVVIYTLEKIGYRADVAANGIEVLHSLSRQDYDVILMDMQMPEMDGLEATRLIRGLSARFRQPRIIAMTANVTNEDRQACLDAGMDDYLAKPIRIEELIVALNKSQSSSLKSISLQNSLTIEKPIKESDYQRVESLSLDPTALNRLLNLVGGDKENYFKLIDSFLEETPKLLTGIRKAMENNDYELLRRMSHTIKSTSRDFGANQLANLGAKLEAISKTASMDEAPDLIVQAEKEYASVVNALKFNRVGADHV